MTPQLKPKEVTSNHRAVAPVIATLLMVAIAVVGGTIIFVFTQGFFSSTQISSAPAIESIKILGYDARDVATLQSHEGNNLLTGSAGSTDGTVGQGDRIAVYFQNAAVQKTLIAVLTLAGTEYNFTNTATTLDTAALGAAPAPGEYAIIDDVGASGLLQTASPEINSGEIGTVVIGLDDTFKIGRDAQFKLSTTNGNVFVGTVVIGQQSG